MSIVRKFFKNERPQWIIKGPEMEADWSASLQTLEGHHDSVHHIGFSPDGEQLASGSWSQVRIWDTVTGTNTQTIQSHVDAFSAIIFLPDSKQLASISPAQTVNILDMATGSIIKTLQGDYSESIVANIFSPGGEQLASVTDDAGHEYEDSRPVDGTVRIWNIATGVTVKIPTTTRSNSVPALVFSPDGKYLAYSSFGLIIQIWNTATGVSIQTLTAPGRCKAISAFAFSLDSKFLASTSYDMTIQIWNLVTGIIIQSFKGHSNQSKAVAFSPDGKQLATGSWDHTVRIWDIATGKTIQTLKGHYSRINAIAFSPDGRQLASASSDYTVRIWDIATNTTIPTASFEGHAIIYTATFSSDGKWLASFSVYGTVRIWDTATTTTVHTITNHSSVDGAIVFSPDGKQLVSGSENSVICIWDIATGIKVQTLKGHSNIVDTIAFSPDGKQLASGSRDYTIRIWDKSTGASLQTIKLDEAVSRLSYSNNWLIVTDQGHIDTTCLPYKLARPQNSSNSLLVESKSEITVQDEWIVYAGNRMLWLPPEYRPRCSSVFENMVCLGTESLGAFIFEFSF
jgi:WD40 repeat protein